MTMMRKFLAGGAAIAALGMAAPAAAQYAYPYQQPYGNAYGYGYAQPYGNAYGYRQQQITQMATQQCAAAVQSRLYNRGSGGLGAILGAVLGANTQTNARVVGFTRVTPRRSTVRVTGLASSGQYAGGYGPYGVGAYGAAGYGYQPDLSFRCDVDYRGRVRDVDIFRRR